MTKATKILNDYHIREMLINGNPIFENFYKDELVKFCKISKEIINELLEKNKAIEKKENK